jgi:hypothetical protein
VEFQQNLRNRRWSMGRCEFMTLCRFQDVPVFIVFPKTPALTLGKSARSEIFYDSCRRLFITWWWLLDVDNGNLYCWCYSLVNRVLVFVDIGAAGFKEMCPLAHFKISLSRCLDSESRPQREPRSPDKEILFLVCKEQLKQNLFWSSLSVSNFLLRT